MSPDIIHAIAMVIYSVLEYFLGKSQHGSLIGFVSKKISSIFKKKEV